MKFTNWINSTDIEHKYRIREISYRDAVEMKRRRSFDVILVAGSLISIIGAIALQLN